MPFTKRTLIRLATPLCLGLALCGGAAAADDYPSKPTRIIVPYPPGGFNDTLARTVGDRLGKVWKQSVVVDNRPGGNTVLGNNIAAKAPADGYTILITPLPFSALPALYGSKLPYSALTDFQPLVWAGYTQNALVIRPDLPGVTNLKDLIDYAKKNPGKLNYGSTGSGSSNHLSMELFMSMTGTKMTHVPYKGSAPAMTDLMGGQIPFSVDTVSAAIPQLKSGKIKAIAVTAAKRSALLPNVPTMAESGYPDIDMDTWLILAAPKGLPTDVKARLEKALATTMADADTRAKLVAQGFEPAYSNAAASAALINRELPVMRALAVRANITAD